MSSSSSDEGPPGLLQSSSDEGPPGLLQSSSDEERLSDDDVPGQTGRKAVAKQQQARSEPVMQDDVKRDDGSGKDQGKGRVANEPVNAQRDWEPEFRPETARHSERCRKTGQHLTFPRIREVLYETRLSPTIPNISKLTATYATPGCTVTIDGLQNRPDLNGRTCLILDYIKDTGRLKAEMLDGKEVGLKPENVAFLNGPSEEREEDRRVAEEKRELEAAKKSPKEKSEALMKQHEMTMRVAEEKRREEMRVAEEKRWADAEQKKREKKKREEKRKREEEERRRREEEQRRIEKERKRKEAQEEREFMATWGEAVELLMKMPTRTTVAGAGGGAGATSMASQSEGLLAMLPKRRPWMEDMKETQYDFSRWQEEKEEGDCERVAEAQGDAVAGGDADDHSEPPSGVAPVVPGHLEKGAEGGGGERAERGEDPSGVLPASLSENLGMHDLGIWLTEDVKKWYAHADARLATSFMERLERLATRNFGRKVQKRLRGSTTVPIFEAYLDQTRTALRILWTEVVERGTSNIFVWFVSKHKDVSRRMLQIDESFKRLNRRRVDSDAPSVARAPDMQSEASGLKWEHAGDTPPAQGRELVRPDLSEALSRKTEFTKQEWAAFGIRDLRNDDWIKAGESYYKPLAERLVLARDQVLLSPDANTPLKIYELRSSRDLRRMQEEGWEPPLRLTSKEHAVVQERGTVLLLGRSGTGKTICIANKMAWDREDCKAQGGLSQLFVARSGRICRMVGSLQGYSAGLAAVDGAGSSMALRELKKIEQQVMNALGVVSQPHKHVDYNRFKAEVFPAAVKGCKLDALVVWTAMRTFIKGSFEAVMKGQPVEEADFMGLGESRLRLSPDQRREAYHAYTLARAYYATHGLYDDCDKMLEIHNALKAGAELPADLRFYKVYVDEVQDLTNAELALLQRMSESGALFLAGDPAQSVVEGVDFRFKEVRSCFYNFAGCLKKAVPPKPQTLHLNFRSHAGILELAGQILQWLYDFFPGSCDKIDTDEGLCRGPRPGFAYWSTEQLRTLLSSSSLSGSAIVVLTPDENRAALSQEMGFGSEVAALMLGIREAKGLDFAEVLIVDFFKNLDESHHRNWKGMLSEEAAAPHPELETHIKLLYTAVTRAQRRLNFIETRKSRAGDAFSRALEAKEKLVALGDDASLDSVKMSVDDWMARGVEFALQAGDARRSEGGSRTESLSEENLAAEELKWLDRAVGAFRRAGRLGEAAILKAEAQKEEALLRAELLRVPAVPKGGARAVQQVGQVVLRGARAVAGCIRQRMLFEARDLIRVVVRYENTTRPPSAYRESLVQAKLLAPLQERMAS